MSTTFVPLILIVCLSTLVRGIIFVEPTDKKPVKCRCVPSGTCSTNFIIGFDARVLNGGRSADDKNCASGEVWCCDGASDVTDAMCGIRKITNSPAQPAGTARYAAYPWQAALLTEKNAYIGSGVLINANYVLTVAHKVSPYPARNFKVKLGVWNNQQSVETYPQQEYKPTKVTMHPSFTSLNLQNDIALIKLDKTVPLATSPNINCAPLATAVPAAGTRCWVTGWGKTSFAVEGSEPAIMKEVDVPIIDQGTCETRMRATRLGTFFVLDKTSFMCAGGEVGKDACTNDGGSPLVCAAKTGRWEVVGLVTWGIGCASSVPGIYVNVPNYRSWINQQISS